MNSFGKDFFFWLWADGGGVCQKRPKTISGGGGQQITDQKRCGFVQKEKVTKSDKGEGGQQRSFGAEGKVSQKGDHFFGEPNFIPFIDCP